MDHEFKTSLGYSTKHCLKKKKKKKKKVKEKRSGKQRRKKEEGGKKEEEEGEKCKYRHHIGELPKTFNYFTLTQISMN